MRKGDIVLLLLRKKILRWRWDIWGYNSFVTCLMKTWHPICQKAARDHLAFINKPFSLAIEIDLRISHTPLHTPSWCCCHYCCLLLYYHDVWLICQYLPVCLHLEVSQDLSLLILHDILWNVPSGFWKPIHCAAVPAHNTSYLAVPLIVYFSWPHLIPCHYVFPEISLHSLYLGFFLVW